MPRRRMSSGNEEDGHMRSLLALLGAEEAGSIYDGGFHRETKKATMMRRSMAIPRIMTTAKHPKA